MNAKRSQRLTRRTRRGLLWARRVQLSRYVAVVLALALAVSGIATVASMFDSLPVGSDLTTVTVLLNIDLILALALGAVLTRRMVRVWVQQRSGRAGSRLHIRLVALFSLVAVIPAILVAIFAGLFLNFGIESWFSERVRTAVNESEQVARLYLREHQQNIRADALAMANDLNRAVIQSRGNPRVLNNYVTAQAAIRSLPEAIVVDGSGRILARSGLSYTLAFEFASRQRLREAVSRLKPGEVVTLSDENNSDRVRALVKLESFVDAFLLVGRFVDTQVLDHLSRTQGAATQYAQLEKSRDSLQIKFLLVFVLVAILLLLASVWLGWSVSTQLATPISNLIDAAERVRNGDITARVAETTAQDEIGTLSRAFNRMTSQLDQQQQGLIAANKQLDERRRFTETVLEGVSAGVIGLDEDGQIHLPNRSASELLSTELDAHIGAPLIKIVPEMSELFRTAQRRPNRGARGEVILNRDGRVHTLLVYIAAEQGQDEIFGYVVTFDDVTQLVSAQRKAAWADVARRIAHEIKNPLTPIQLSAERLWRKYATEIKSDPETFRVCTETIVRQVEDIGRMVDEFSSFARMPQPEIRNVDLVELCREIQSLEQNRYPEIGYLLDLPAESVYFRCDRQQLGRALTNILKNAAESVMAPDREDSDAGEIRLALDENGDSVHLIVQDNGKGLPEILLHRLTEPYVTTREKGTGLGLAIAKKIMEDHQGELNISNRPRGGAEIVLAFEREYEPPESAINNRTSAEKAADLAERIAHGV